MNSSLIFTFFGPDKPGLVEKLAKTVSDGGGNWLESRMSQLAGQFAGIVSVEVQAEKLDPLRQALQALNGDELTITLQTDPGTRTGESQQTQQLRILGGDRPGIVSEVARALAQHGINVCEMNTRVSSAPMSAEALFEAHAEIAMPEKLQMDELLDQLDEVADQLSLDISLD